MGKRIGVVGLGNLGSAVVRVLDQNSASVIGWEYDNSVVEDVNNHGQNHKYLPGCQYSNRVTATSDMSQLLEQSGILFITLPARFITPVFSPYLDSLPKDIALVNMAKGIHTETNKTAAQTLMDMFPNNPFAVVSGPSLANEFAIEKHTAVVAASKSNELCHEIKRLLTCHYFHVVVKDDVKGVELGGILKNIYALALGVLVEDVQEHLNFTGAFITQAIGEMAELMRLLGGEPESVYELSGVGDLICTAMSPHSHNRKFGKLLAKGLTAEQAEAQMSLLPESYHTLQFLMPLVELHGVKVPIAQALWQGLQHGISHEAFTTVVMESLG